MLRHLARLFPASLVALFALGCGVDTSTGTSATAVPTSIGVDPADFLGALGCDPEAGDARSYVATITDQTICPATDQACSAGSQCCSGVCTIPAGSSGTDDDGRPTGSCAPKEAPTTLPSSPPLRCNEAVYFRGVIAGHEYSAEIDAYDVDASELLPAASPLAAEPGRWTGAREMLVASSLAPSAPALSASCGLEEGLRAVAVDARAVYVDACGPLEPPEAAP